MLFICISAIRPFLRHGLSFSLFGASAFLGSCVVILPSHLPRFLHFLVLSFPISHFLHDTDYYLLSILIAFIAFIAFFLLLSFHTFSTQVHYPSPLFTTLPHSSPLFPTLHNSHNSSPLLTPPSLHSTLVNLPLHSSIAIIHSSNPLYQESV